jgi:flagellar hook-associated protein 1 FlgK
MSTLGSVLNTALSSLMANQLALAVASNNIANANNPDYTRQRLLTQPAVPDGTRWHIGTGVEVVGLEAVRDTLLETRLRHEISAQTGADTLADRLSNIEPMFNDPADSGLLQSITRFFNSFHTLSQDPASLPFREQVKTSAAGLIEALRTRDASLTNIRTGADKAIAADISEVNRLTREIAAVTLEIKDEELGTTTSNELRDRRASLIKELSKYVEVNELDSGDYQLTTKDNHLLVLNGMSTPLTPADVTSTIGAGSLSAEVEVRDTYVPKYAAALDQLAYDIAQQVNSIHSSAYDLNGNTNIDFFTPLSSAAGAARLLSLSTDVAGDSRKIAASRLASGNDNGAAIELGNLLNAPVFSGGSVTDQYGALVFAIGTDAANAKSSTSEHQALVTQLQNRRQSISGVSIDEETVQVLQFQRAYQASARLIQTVDQLLEVTLGLGA